MNRKMWIVLATIFSSYAPPLFAQTQPGATPAETKTVPVFVDGQAQIVSGFNNPPSWIKQDLWVETEFDTDGDGKKDRMHVDVTRPPQTETEGLKLPVIYESSPYFAGTSGNARQFFWNIEQEVDAAPAPRQHGPDIRPRNQRPIISNSLVGTWVPRGFIVVHSEGPGSGLSQGIPTVGGDPECLAPKAVIDWLNGRAPGFTTPHGDEKVVAYWTTGKVGMTGTSYNGTIPVAAACTGVAGLEAIIPIAPNTSYYHYYRTNGLVRNPAGFPGEDIDYLFDFIHSGNMDDPVKRQFALTTMRDGEMARGQDRATGDYNEFWASRDLLPRVGNMKAALLMAHAFNDWNVVCEHSVRIYEAVKDKVPSMIYMHQGGHGGGPPMELQNKWFTRYLCGVENGVEKEPRAWIVRENDPPTKPTPYQDYPHPDASPVTLHLSGDGLKAGNLGTAAIPAPGKETLVDDAAFTSAQLAGAESNHRLLFATPVLTAPVHISGFTTITVKLACSKPAANLSVYLVELPWTQAPAGGGGRGRGAGAGGGVKITDNLITRGWADPQNYRSLTNSAPPDYHSLIKGEPLVPGQFYEMTFALEPDDQIIPVGKKIGVMIFSSDQEFTVHPQPGAELTVDLDATTLRVPVVGGEKAFNEAVKQN
jgi:X-Pro dipeptidyl-peptidase